MSVNREIQVGLWTPKSVPYTAMSASLRSPQGGLAVVPDVPLGHHRPPTRFAVLQPAEGMDAAARRWRMPNSGSSVISTSAIR